MTDEQRHELFQLVNSDSAPDVVARSLTTHFPADTLASGAAVSAYRGEFVWAIRSTSRPHLYVDDEPTPPMERLPGDLWVHSLRVRTGTSHAHQYRVDGEVLGGKRFDTAAYGKDSYMHEGVPQGKYSEELFHESPTYRGWQVSYWLYASPGVDPDKPSAVMVWQDGHRFLERGKRSRIATVVENLVHQGKIPPMVLVLIAPGRIGSHDNEASYAPSEIGLMRSLLYDTFSDDYNKMVVDEIFPAVNKTYRLRDDGYSRAIGGQSSGGICSLNSAWFRPHDFSRVLSRIGSYASIQWRWGQENPFGAYPLGRFGDSDPCDPLDGGNIWPFLVRKRGRKNIRVWLEDGTYDLENAHGSWPLQNIQLANSLKMMEYDFKFSFGNAQHSTTYGDAELPAALAWLWRDYDPMLIHQTYVMDPAEKDKPYFRVKICNR
ncbi:MAG: alpha/beta hydrolase-fold protein [Bryobacterales bacterium]|nr:alpha/beta hydrolase-fold protein [Bryobacterales bacterium]